jgi:hypothetical protein
MRPWSTVSGYGCGKLLIMKKDAFSIASLSTSTLAGRGSSLRAELDAKCCRAC